jgi:hypothetical protein
VRSKPSREKLIASAKTALLYPAQHASDAAALCGTLDDLVHGLGLGHEPEVQELVVRFMERAHAFGEDSAVLVNQMEYAIRLAEADCELLYEELHKLLSLCDDVFVLEVFGMRADASLKAQFDSVVAERLLRRPRQAAAMAAGDKVVAWKRERWWYAELVGPRSPTSSAR